VLGVIHVAAQCFERFVLTSMDDPADLVAVSCHDAFAVVCG